MELLTPLLLPLYAVPFVIAVATTIATITITNIRLGLQWPKEKGAFTVTGRDGQW